MHRIVLGAAVAALCSGATACGSDKQDPEAPGGGDAFEGASLPRPAVSDLVVGPDGRRYVGGALFVAGVGAEDAVLGQGGTITGEIPNLDIVYATFDVDDGGLAAVEAAISSRPGVVAVSRDWAEAQPRDSREVSDSEELPATTQVATDANGVLENVNLGDDGLWAYTDINMFRAWDAIHEANPVMLPVRIAVVDDLLLDTGVFGGVIAERADLRLEYDYDVGGFQHAHRVASIIGAPNDGKGMTGIMAGLDCVEYDMVAIAVLGTLNDDQGNYDHVTTMSVILAGLIRAVQLESRVVNMSFGATSNDPGIAKLYEILFKAAPDVLFVASAGNDGGDAALEQPAAVVLEGVANLVSVAAYDRAGQPAQWYGGSGTSTAVTPGSITLAAPGTDVLATAPSAGLEFFKGTSASAPMVSGVAGLMFAIDPDLTGAEVRQELVAAARAGVPSGISGRALDAAAAVEAVLAGVPDIFLDEGTCREEEDPSDGPCDGANKQCDPGPLVSTCAPGLVCDADCQCQDPGPPTHCILSCGDDGECPSAGGFGHCFQGRCVVGSCRSDTDCAELGTVGTMCARRGNKTQCVHPCSAHEDCPDDVLDQACVEDSDGRTHCYFVSEMCDCSEEFHCDGGTGLCQCSSNDQCAEELPCQ